ncbi:hypothetical protein [Nocardioides sp. SYSU DS0663]|uniref:hypothetical protein n=1 Tax=Nocardioides sp. SYSU DS0663 TaxID=3416445 RepID=UPI003F4C7E43
MHSRRLAATALSYAVLHHLGLLPDGLGTAPEGTRWADWLDLAVPWLVLAPAAATLASAPATGRAWLTFGAGALAYASGHGIHLAANSVANADPGPTAHLWDEVVGHVLWYAGVAVVAAAVATTMRGRRRPTGHRAAVGIALALGVGITWATNALGGVGTTVPGLVVALAGAAWGWRHRRELPGLVLVASAAAVVVLGGALALRAT